MRNLFAVFLAVTIASCTQPKEPARATSNPSSSPGEAEPGQVTKPNEPAGAAASTAAASASASSAPPPSLDDKVGQVITVEGVAFDAKLGAILSKGSSWMIWIDGLDSWPSALHGKKVQVTGKVIERSDLPVFVHREGELQRQGMPVPPGTDLAKARRRLLLAEAKWKVLE